MKKQHLELSPEDRVTLLKLHSKGSLRVKKQKRILCLLELDKGKSYVEVCELLSVSYPAVLGWARKYRESGLVFLDDRPRPGRPVGISGEERAKVTALACSDPPDGHARWTLRLLADKVVEMGIVEGMSHTQAGAILKKTNSSHTESGSGVSGN
jgi:putative transposase